MRCLHDDRLFAAVHPRRFGLRAVALSTLAFMLAHMLWPAAIVAGLAYAWLYRRAGELWTAVVAHAVTDCCQPGASAVGPRMLSESSAGILEGPDSCRQTG